MHWNKNQHIIDTLAMEILVEQSCCVVACAPVLHNWHDLTPARWHSILETYQRNHYSRLANTACEGPSLVGAPAMGAAWGASAKEEEGQETAGLSGFKLHVSDGGMVLE